MAPFKKDLTALTKGGSIHKHAGKGSSTSSIPSRGQISQLSKPAGQSVNNYSKATPMANPAPDPSLTGSVGLGSGNWAGNGM